MSDEEAVIRRTEYTWHPIMPSLLMLLQDLRDSLKFRPTPANLGGYDSIDARRLVACWNEHDGLVHDNARLYQSLQGEMQGRLKAEQERDEALDVLRKFSAWNEKYPSSRTYSHHQIGPIAKELDAINSESVDILAKHNRPNHDQE